MRGLTAPALGSGAPSIGSTLVCSGILTFLTTKTTPFGGNLSHIANSRWDRVALGESRLEQFAGWGPCERDRERSGADGKYVPKLNVEGSSPFARSIPSLPVQSISTAPCGEDVESSTDSQTPLRGLFTAQAG